MDIKKTSRILTDHGDVLIYDEMEKRVGGRTDRISYDEFASIIINILRTLKLRASEK